MKTKREKIRQKYGCKCGYCGCDIDLKTMQIDHIIPKSDYMWVQSDEVKNKIGFPLYSPNDYINFMPTCKICNHYKRDLPIDPYREDRVGFRQYMLKFHIRLGKLPKKTQVAGTERRKEYMQEIADRYNITPTQPFNGLFYFETLTKSLK